ncbi:MAG TPA: glycine cleavage system aminomethyltransferase GcvT [Trichocoleus sp.]
MNQTPLHGAHLQLNARMTGFAGWDMPVQYVGIKQEHQAVREQAGMFDISHMGKFTLQGPDVISQLQRLVPSDLSQLIPGKAQYTVLLNPQGGIVDDLILYLLPDAANGDQRVFTIINAATTEKDRSWLLKHLTETVKLHDLSREQALIAVQGPEAATQLQPFVKEDLSAVGRYEHIEGTLLSEPAFLARTGYTGEDGFEIMLPAAAAQRLWASLLEAGVPPCGLGARDTLRLEAAMPLYGQDISDTTTPLEAGLNWLVHLDRKGEFIGRSVLELQKEHGVSRKLVGLKMEGRNIARHDYPVMHAGEPVGVVTSGTLGPTLGFPVALAYVSAELAKVGQPLGVDIRGKVYPASIVKRPFYRTSRP